MTLDLMFEISTFETHVFRTVLWICFCCLDGMISDSRIIEVSFFICAKTKEILQIFWQIQAQGKLMTRNVILLLYFFND